MLDEMSAENPPDVVIGSRYVKGGKCVGWPFKRWFISRFGGLFIRMVLGVPVKDPTGGFKCFRRGALEMLGDFSIIRSFGYSFQMEMNFRMAKAGLKLKEIPITFAERRAGSSKISGSIATETLKMVFRLRFGK
jgi:dolichol-phosphate mannosyltransferase